RGGGFSLLGYCGTQYIPQPLPTAAYSGILLACVETHIGNPPPSSSTATPVMSCPDLPWGGGGVLVSCSGVAWRAVAARRGGGGGPGPAPSAWAGQQAQQAQ